MTLADLKKLVEDKYGKTDEFGSEYICPEEIIDPGSWSKYIADMEKLLMRNLPKEQFGIECDKLFGKYGMCVD